MIIPLPAESPSEPIPGLEGSGILAAGVSSHQQALTLPQRPYPVAVSPSQLTEGELTAVLQSAGWPEELIPAALSVAWCESKWSPSAIGDSGSSVGLFQLNKQTWFIYAGEDSNMWMDPATNARTALATYYYDINRGSSPWKQWTCKP